MRLLLLVIFVFQLMCSMSGFAQGPIVPAVKNNYQKVTSYDELSSFVNDLDKYSDLLKSEIIGKSAEGRNIYVLKFSDKEFNQDQSKIKVLFFAQQHGNEQSGKEGALLLAMALLKAENRYLFDRIDFALIPQVNPDGSEQNQRRNGNKVDLNRNHLILSEPETIALHQFFDQYSFEVILDVHEYSPYGKDWLEYGYRKNADITIGGATNPNVAEPIRKMSNDKILPHVINFLNKQNFSAFEYCPGGPPKIGYMRQSTFDINDGRQSLGIQNTFSFIQEGMNGTDMYLENLKHRTEGQMTGMLGLLEYVYHHQKEMKNTVVVQRRKLNSEKSNTRVSIQTDHVSNGKKTEFPMFSYHSKTDTMLLVDYRPLAKSITEVQKPLGYLIPKKIVELVRWAEKHALVTKEYRHLKSHVLEQYFVEAIDSFNFENDMVADPKLRLQKINAEIPETDYIFIETSNIKGNMIVLALEPKSMIGLVNYPEYAHLLKAGTVFPVLRVVKK